MTCLVIEKASESAHCEVFGRLFPREERDRYLLEIATELFVGGGGGLVVCVAVGSLTPDHISVVKFVSICRTFGKAVASWKEILIRYWSSC